jgi:hypothetical protein
VSAKAGGEGVSQQVRSMKTGEVGGKSIQLCSSSSGLVYIYICLQDNKVQVQRNQQGFVK